MTVRVSFTREAALVAFLEVITIGGDSAGTFQATAGAGLAVRMAGRKVVPAVEGLF